MPDFEHAGKAVEFRGCDSLVIAEVLTDSLTEAYTTGSVQVLAPVAEISKTVDSNSETHWYDNTGMIIIRAEGSDEVTLTVPALPLSTLGLITGKVVDELTGAFIDGKSVEKYYAIGYRLRLTDGSYRYVWRLKGAFSIPDETSSTENDGVDTNNQQIVYTGVKTISEFDNGGGMGVPGQAKAVVIDERDNKCDLTTFFSIVQTPDTIQNLAVSIVTNVALNKTTTSIAVGSSETLTATTTPSGKPVSWQSSNASVASVSSAGAVTANRVGTTVITATSGRYSASCLVTVTSG